jgi:2'-hydroxyisoflavone reductase
MTVTRRRFLETAALTGACAALPTTVSARIRSVRAPLRILILGGTGFIGPHQVRTAIARGHAVSVFNRGRRGSEGLPAAVEQLTGDRETNDYAALKGKTWDAVIDNSAYVPRWVREARTALQGAVGQYVFTSTTSVYALPNAAVVDEDSPLATLDDPTTEKITNESYGGLKVLCEKEVRQFSGVVTIVRPHYIVGPDDPTDRFTYWPVRVKRGGEMLAPGAPEDPFQFVDARDFASFLIHLIERRTAGTFNAVRPALPLRQVLETIRKTTGATVTFTWVETPFLLERKIQMPMWDPPVGEGLGGMATSAKRAEAAGLRRTPLETTVRDTLAWWEAEPETRRAKPRAFLPAEKEAEVLAAWHAAKG